MMKKSNLVKIAGISLVLILAAFVFAACVYEAVHYCPFCGKSGIQEISEFNTENGKTEIYYKCTNSGCEKTFGAGLAPKGGN